MKNLREWMDEVRAAGSDPLGIADDPETLVDLAKVHRRRTLAELDVRALTDLARILDAGLAAGDEGLVDLRWLQAMCVELRIIAKKVAERVDEATVQAAMQGFRCMEVGANGLQGDSREVEEEIDLEIAALCDSR